MTLGFVYAVQPVGMSIVKIGSTNQPKARIEALASFSPVTVTFRHLLQVSCARVARIQEAALLGWTNSCAMHGEWRGDLELVDDCFACIAPAVDVAEDYQMITRRPKIHRVLSDSRIEDLLAFGEAVELLEERLRPQLGNNAKVAAHQALGMAWTSTPVNKVIADNARAYLAAARGAA